MSTINTIRHDTKEDLWMSSTATAITRRPVAPPTLSLPSLRKLNGSSIEQIKSSLRNLRTIYFPPPPPSFVVIKPMSEAEPKDGQGRILLISPLPNLDMKRRDDHDATSSVAPDSGYASAEEDEDEDVGQDLDSTWISSNSCERDFAINWVVCLIARSDVWMASTEAEDLEEEAQMLLDEAVDLLDAFHRAADEEAEEGEEEGEEEDGALVREFVFPLGSTTPITGKPMEEEPRKEVHVRLNDLPPSQDDHTSVGLQSWGSCILLAEMICADPERFLMNTPVSPACSNLNRHPLETGKKIRILELGSGTGMLSIVCAKIMRDCWSSVVEGEVVATDYHAGVLGNLEGNVKLNLLGKGVKNVEMTVSHLDWEYPTSYNAKFDEGSFDIVLAADVVYHPQHARWIKGVVERLLVKPLSCDCEGVCSASAPGTGLGGGTFWLFIPVRTTGRHEGMVDTVSELFPLVKFGTMGSPVVTLSTRLELAIMDSEEVSRRDGVGRADEVGYRLYRIKWVLV